MSILWLSKHAHVIFTTVVIWINPVYFGKEGDTVALTVYREGYLGSSTETISKSCVKLIKRNYFMELIYFVYEK